MISVADDLLDPALIADPFPYYRQLREERPVHWNERWRGWVVSLYEDVYAGLHDKRMLADTITPFFQTRMTAAERERFAQLYDVLNSWVVFVDPPKHTYLRKLLSRAFTPRSVERMREVVEGFVAELLDGWDGRSDIDLIADFAYPLPANVVATMIGAPREDMHLFHAWADDLTNLLHGGVGSPDRMARSQQVIIEFKDYLSILYRERLTKPRDDMMSWLMEVQRGDPQMREEDVLYSCMLLLNAGHETTQNLIGNTTVSLLVAPDQVALLRERPDAIKTGIEECLRMNGPMKGTMRVAGEDMTIRGTPVRQGDRILLLMAAANRDPAKFADPERMNVLRSPNPHLSFGHGLHFCLGAPLARMEMEIGLREMLRRFPRLELSGEVRYQPRILSRSIQPPIPLAAA